MIEFDHVSVTFQNRGKKFLAVSDVTLTVETGEFFGIVGPSGAGKSTLVRTVNRLQRTDSGSIRIDGREITGLKGRALREERLKIGMIFQHFNLIMNADVGRNIEFALLAAGVSGRKTEERTKELLSLVGLSEKLHAYPAELSGGQKQRVAIARALANRPEILLCDEATSALDPENTAEVIEVLKRIKETYPLTILFITHQMEVARQLFDRMAVMENGRIIEAGDTYELFTDPKEEVTKQLVSKSFELSVPEELLTGEREIFIVSYSGKEAYEPLLNNMAKQFQVSVSILGGKIEYICRRPYGVIVISMEGEREEKEKAAAYMRRYAKVEKRAAVLEVRRYGYDTVGI